MRPGMTVVPVASITTSAIPGSLDANPICAILPSVIRMLSASIMGFEISPEINVPMFLMRVVDIDYVSFSLKLSY